MNELLLLCTDLNCANDYKQTALYFAVWSKNPAIIEILLCHRADVNVVDSDSDSALHLAALEGAESIMWLLLSQNNITVDQPSKNLARTSLYCAATNGSENLVSLLLSHNASPDGILDENKAITALQAVANQSHLGIVKLHCRCKRKLRGEIERRFRCLARSDTKKSISYCHLPS